jgi:adenylate kinase
VTKLVAKTLAHIKSLNKGYILDGFPRTRAQAEDLDKMLKDLKQPLDYVIYMETTPSLIIKRIAGRWIAPQSGMVYHISNRPPKVPGICDVSGEKLVQRPDDTEEKVKKRMSVYLESTLPIVEYYEAQGSLLKIDGDAETEDLLEELKEIFNENTKNH